MRRCLFHVSCALVMMAFGAASVWGHTLPRRSVPRVGEVVAASPDRIRIWFDGALDGTSSTVCVYEQGGRQVDNGDGHVDPSDGTLLEVSLPPLSPGGYRVVWRVVSRDGHHTEGEFKFRLR